MRNVLWLWGKQNRIDIFGVNKHEGLAPDFWEMLANELTLFEIVGRRINALNLMPEDVVTKFGLDTAGMDLADEIDKLLE